MTDDKTVVIDVLGLQGDGIVRRGDEAVFLRYALPGETWRITSDGQGTCVEPAPDRRAPICRHYTTCGGCIAQHMPSETYRAWKREAFTRAFENHRLEPEIAPLVTVAPRSRRRAFFGIARKGAAVVLGFREEGSHTLVPLAECPLLDPAITDAFERLAAIGDVVLGKEEAARLVVTKLDQGLDVAIECDRRKLTATERARLAALSEGCGVLRLMVGGEEVVLRAPPRLTIGGVAVEPAPGAFLQAVPEAEKALIELVLAGLRKEKRIADLFSGLGTFTFPLARIAPVLAVDSDKRALAALGAAHRHATGLKPVETRLRNLVLEPLSPKELEPFTAVVLDPPRAGAKAQAEMLARSKVPTVVMVSCNAVSLARDVRILVDGGYKPGPVTPIDQFLFSPHTEAVMVLRR